MCTHGTNQGLARDDGRRIASGSIANAGTTTNDGSPVDARSANDDVVTNTCWLASAWSTHDDARSAFVRGSDVGLTDGGPTNDGCRRSGNEPTGYHIAINSLCDSRRSKVSLRGMRGVWGIHMQLQHVHI